MRFGEQGAGVLCSPIFLAVVIRLKLPVRENLPKPSTKN
jgi:hypothetical protein